MSIDATAHMPAKQFTALAASVSIEAAELLELFQWLTDEAIETKVKSAEFRTAFRGQLADVMLYLLSLANQLDIDVSDAIIQKLIKNRRKYPVDLILGKFEQLSE